MVKMQCGPHPGLHVDFFLELPLLTFLHISAGSVSGGVA